MRPDSPGTADSVIVLEVVGDLDIATQDRFEATLTDLLSRSSVIVDASGVEFLAISALRSLVLCQKAAAREHRVLTYAGMPPGPRRLMTMAELDHVLVQSQSVGAAWASMTGGIPPQVRHDVPSLPRRRLVFLPATEDGVRGRPVPQPRPGRETSRWSGRTFTP